MRKTAKALTVSSDKRTKRTKKNYNKRDEDDKRRRRQKNVRARLVWAAFFELELSKNEKVHSLARECSAKRVVMDDRGMLQGCADFETHRLSEEG
jgi:hypothetical protein